MADYYTSFSCLLDVGSTDNTQKALDHYRAFADELEETEYCAIGFDVTIEPGGNGSTLWIHDGDSGDPEHVIQFARRCAKAFGLKGRWGFEYANTCSKPHLDAYGGGAHVLDLGSGRTIGRISTHEWLVTRLAEDDAGPSA